FRMDLQELLTHHIKEAVKTIFGHDAMSIEFQPTRKDFEGDITVVLFPLVKQLRSNPAEIGAKLGEYLTNNVDLVSKCNVVSGFLNVVISDSYYTEFFNRARKQERFGYHDSKSGKGVMVEFSSPNTNKPLHLGHIRNILLGHSVAKIQEAAGKKVYTTQIINDRGIHICKSMLAWKMFGNGETPESSGLKGDKLVGKYYVEFDKAYKQQIGELMAEGKSEDEAKKLAPVMLEAQKMLQQWEAGDPEVIKLWEMMNAWVYDGFNETYRNIGVSFDRNYYESQTYLLGKSVVEDGL